MKARLRSVFLALALLLPFTAPLAQPVAAQATCSLANPAEDPNFITFSSNPLVLHSDYGTEMELNFDDPFAVQIWDTGPDKNGGTYLYRNFNLGIVLTGTFTIEETIATKYDGCVGFQKGGKVVLKLSMDPEYGSPIFAELTVTDRVETTSLLHIQDGVRLTAHFFGPFFYLNQTDIAAFIVF